jgi:outer membrane protein assembly factor BamB
VASETPVGDVVGAPSSSPAPERRLLPGPWASVVIMCCVVGILLVQYAAIPLDHADANLLSLGLSVVVLVTLLAWFVAFSSYRRRLRLGTLYATLTLLIAAIATVRIYQVSGELVPSFRFVWSNLPDQRLPRNPESSGGPVDLDTQTPFDFPQFLGPQRNGRATMTVSTEVGMMPLLIAREWDSQGPELLWKQPIGAGWSAFSAVNGFAVTMEQRDDQELVTCYEISTGKLRWAHGIEGRHSTTLGGIGPRCTPTIDNGRVYAQTATGKLVCLNGRDGSRLWLKDLPSEFGVAPGEDTHYVRWGRAASPLIVDNLVVIPAGGPTGQSVSLAAYDKVTGERVWTAGSWQISYSSPIVATFNDFRQIISVNENTVSGHDPQNGAILWHCEWPGSSVGEANTSQPNVFENSIVVTKAYHGGCKRFEVADDGKCREIFHIERILRTKLTSAIVDEPFAYALSDGILECIDLRDGNTQWKAGRYGHGQMLLVRDLLLIMTENSGELVAVEASPERHIELARAKLLNGKTWNNMCLYGPLLLVRNAEEAACYRLPNEIPTTPFSRGHPPHKEGDK